MAESEPENLVQPPSAALAQPASDARLVRFACRVMLVANLLLAGIFCFLVVPAAGGVNLHDIIGVPHADQPPMTRTTQEVLALPPIIYQALTGGLVAILIILAFVAPGRKIALIANAAAMALLVLAIVLVEFSLRAGMDWLVNHY